MTDRGEATRIDVAREAAHGRYASTIWGITVAGWRDILHRTAERTLAHKINLVAAAVAFFFILSIFPALATIVTLYGILADPATLQTQLAALYGVIPAQAVSLLEEHFARFTEQGKARLGIAFLLGLLVTFWFANAGLKALFQALNIVYEETEKRSWIRFNLETFRAAAALFGVLLVVSALTVALPIILDRFGLGAAAAHVVAVVRWPFLAAVATVCLMIVYRIGPSREPPRWRWIGWGSLLTALVWLAASGVFSFYLANFANYNVTYGSLGAVVGFMLWLYVSVFVTLVGAELNAEIEHQLAVDTTDGPARSMGRRGAYKADRLAAAKPWQGRSGAGERRRRSR